MGSEVIIVPFIFSAMFGVVYLFFSTRNKERLALIEKGADASIFLKGKGNTPHVWKVVLLNLALLLIGIGAGIFLAALLNGMGVKEEVAYPGTIFLMAGISLFTGFKMTKNMD